LEETGLIKVLDEIMCTLKMDGTEIYRGRIRGHDAINLVKDGIDLGEFESGEHKTLDITLQIDEDMDKSTVFNGHDETYGFSTLLSPGTTQLTITKLEIWGLGSEEDYANQENYWQLRNKE
jgi:hypothetical protein